jgi:hypothetical protein
MKKLALVDTVNWYAKVINTPFADPWLKDNPDLEVINIMDDSLLAESLPNLGPTSGVIRRLIHYLQAAEATGADVIMSTCSTMGLGIRIAKKCRRMWMSLCWGKLVWHKFASRQMYLCCK